MRRIRLSEVPDNHISIPGIGLPITLERPLVNKGVVHCVIYDIGHERYKHTDCMGYMIACNQCGIEGKKLYYYNTSDSKGILLCESCHPGMMTPDELAEL